MQMSWSSPSAAFAQFREGQLVGRMLFQRLATGATRVKQARYRRGGSEALVRQYIHSLSSTIVCMEAPWHLLFTTHGVYEFRRGCCTLVLPLYLQCESTGMSQVT